MEIRLYRYVVEIAKQKSMTKASSVLHIAQPSLSQQLKKLEDKLGVSLFNGS